jgi:hypothetical protein
MTVVEPRTECAIAATQSAGIATDHISKAGLANIRENVRADRRRKRSPIIPQGAAGASPDSPGRETANGRYGRSPFRPG